MGWPFACKHVAKATIHALPHQCAKQSSSLVICLSLTERPLNDPTPTRPNTPRQTRNEPETDPKRTKTDPKWTETSRQNFLLLSGFWPKRSVENRGFLVDFPVDFFLLLFPRKRALKIRQKFHKKMHRGNQTPKNPRLISGKGCP